MQGAEGSGVDSLHYYRNMTKNLAPEWRAVASSRLRGRLIYASGSAVGARPPPSRVRLETVGHEPQSIFGALTCRQDRGLPEAVSEIHFSMTGQVQGRDAAAVPWDLVLEWDNGRDQRVRLQSPANEPAPAMQLAPWRRYLRTTADLIKRREFALLASEVSRVLRSAVASRRDPRSLLAWLARSRQRLVLVVDHDLGGGSGVYRAQLITGLLAEGRCVLRLAADHENLGYQLVAQRGARSRAAVVRDFAELRELFSAIRFDTTYFNNLLSFPETAAVVKALGEWLAGGTLGKLIFLVHDFYSVCPSWTLIDKSDRHCGVPDLSVCAACLPSNRLLFGSLAGVSDVAAWRALWEPVLRGASEVRCFSESSRILLRRAYPGLTPDRLTVVPHGQVQAPLRKIEIHDPGAPVVGVVGAISVHKGAQVLRDLSRHLLDTKNPMRLVVVGTTECELAPEVATVTGPYRRGDLPGLLEANRVNVGFVPSICPETFSYVTDELMQMGLPVLVFDLGAPPERVGGYARGRVMAIGGPAEIVEAVTHLYRAHVRPSAAGQ